MFPTCIRLVSLIHTYSLSHVDTSTDEHLHILLNGISVYSYFIPRLLPLALAHLFTYARAELLTKAHWCDISVESSGEWGGKGARGFNKFLRALGLILRACGVISQCC